MARVYEIDGMIPVIHPEAFVHPDAVLIGDAIVGAGCYVGPGASLRGDMGRVELKQGANLQDNCIMHGFPNGVCVVGVNGHIGHGAILHGCTVGDDALVGMNAVVMDEAVIGEKAIVAACAFVPTAMTVEPATLVGGVPARVMRSLTEKEIAWKRQGTGEYHRLAERCRATLRAVEPLTEEEADRPCYQDSDFKTLQQARSE